MGSSPERECCRATGLGEPGFSCFESAAYPGSHGRVGDLRFGSHSGPEEPGSHVTGTVIARTVCPTAPSRLILDCAPSAHSRANRLLPPQ